MDKPTKDDILEAVAGLYRLCAVELVEGLPGALRRLEAAALDEARSDTMFGDHTEASRCERDAETFAKLAEAVEVILKARAARRAHLVRVTAE